MDHRLGPSPRCSDIMDNGPHNPYYTHYRAYYTHYKTHCVHYTQRILLIHTTARIICTTEHITCTTAHTTCSDYSAYYICTTDLVSMFYGSKARLDHPGKFSRPCLRLPRIKRLSGPVPVPMGFPKGALPMWAAHQSRSGAPAGPAPPAYRPRCPRASSPFSFEKTAMAPALLCGSCICLRKEEMKDGMEE